MNRFLLSIGGLLIGLLALLFVAPTVVDWNRYRGVFEEEATRFLGRDVRVGGRVNLRLLPVPYVRFEQVRVADTVANVGKPLFMADDLTIWLSISGLLRGGIEASAVELSRPAVTLVLDGKGGGSWSSLAPGKWNSALSPNGIAFNSVRISDGSIGILSPTGVPRAVFEHINGELSASAIEGPYKVSAAYTNGKAPREIRLSTAKPAEDGTVRVKGTVRDPASGVSYTVDGMIKDVLTQTKLTGDLTARLPLPTLSASGGQKQRRDGEFDVRSKLFADTKGLALKDLALSFEQAGRPQLATGEMQVAWADQTDIKLALKSHWLDLDKIGGSEATEPAPLKLAQSLAAGLYKVLESEGRTEATLQIEQATLGGDVVSDLAVTLEQAGEKLSVKGFRAALPGGTSLTANGAFDLKGSEPRYDGNLGLRGASLARLMTWVANNKNLPLPPRDEPFSIKGDVTLGQGTLAGRKLAIRVGSNVLDGDISWQDGATRLLTVKLDGSELDISPVLEPGLDGFDAMRSLVSQLAGQQSSAKKTSAAATSQSNAKFDIRVGRLVAGKAVLRDAQIELQVQDGNLTVPALKFSSDEGYALDIRGEVADLAKPEAKGKLNAYARAERPAGVLALSRILNLPVDLKPSVAWATTALPLSMAATIEVSARGPGLHNIVADGNLGTSRVYGSARLGPAVASWRDRTADFALTIDGDRGPSLIFGQNPVASSSATGVSPQTTAGATTTSVSVRAIGTASKGLKSLASVVGPQMEAQYSGTLGIDEKGNVDLAGTALVDIADIGQGLSVLGLTQPIALSGPAKGEFSLSRNAKRTTLASENIILAGTAASGRLVLEPAVANSLRVTGELAVQSAGLPALLQALTTANGNPRARAGMSAWSESPIDLASMDRIAGSKVRVLVKRLSLTPALVLTDAAVDVTTRPRGLELRLTESKAMGGRATGIIGLEKAPAGISLAAEGRLSGAHIEALALNPANTAASGGVTFNVKGSSTALTPRGLIVALTGSGELALDRVTLKRWNPSAVAAAAESIIATRGEVPPDALRQMLALSIAKSGLNFGSHRLPIKLADGTLRLPAVATKTPAGQLTGSLALDLDSQRFDGEWQIDPTAIPAPNQTQPKPNLPGISIAYAGPVANLTSLEPQYNIDTLEREVTVRKVEREVSELERLRREDEERAQLEAQRRAEEQRLEQQRRLEALQRPEAAAPENGLQSPPGAAPAGTPVPPTAANDANAPTAVPSGAPGANPAIQQGQSNALGASQAPATDGTPATADVPATPGTISPPPPRPAQRPRQNIVRPRPDPFGTLRGGGG